MRGFPQVDCQKLLYILINYCLLCMYVYMYVIVCVYVDMYCIVPYTAARMTKHYIPLRMFGAGWHSKSWCPSCVLNEETVTGTWQSRRKAW